MQAKKLTTLNTSSRRYRDPVTEIPWDTLDFDVPWLPDHLLSLHGTEELERLTPEQKMRLSQVEFASFIELGLWLEALFIERLSANSLKLASTNADAYEFQLHELREEVGHSLMFLELMRRAGFKPLTLIYRPRIASLFAKFAPYHSTPFWITILVGEQVPDQMNRKIISFKTLPRAVHAMTMLHMREEARHMEYARLLLAEAIPNLSTPSKALLRPFLQILIRQFLATCFYPAPIVYQTAGLKDPERLANLARRNPERKKLARTCAEPTIRFLAEQNLSLQ